MIQFRDNKVLLCGDVHDPRRLHMLIQRKPSLENRDIVFLGDFGLGFFGTNFDELILTRINEECQKRNVLLYCIRGNHDLVDVWNRNYVFSNLFLVKDYESARFPCGKTSLFVGGGISIDRFYRKEGIDYWKNEITKYQVTKEKFDILFSHDCPDYFNNSTESLPSSPYGAILKDDPNLMDDAFKQRNVMSKIVEDIECRAIFGGHFHNFKQEEKFGIKYRCLNIEEIAEIDAENL